MEDNQYGPGYPVMAYVPVQKPPIPGLGQSIAGMVLGICAWSFSILTFGFASLISAILVLVGLPLSIVGFNRANAVRAPKGMAITGLVLNLAGVAMLGLTVMFGMFMLI